MFLTVLLTGSGIVRLDYTVALLFQAAAGSPAQPQWIRRSRSSLPRSSRGCRPAGAPPTGPGEARSGRPAS